MPLARVGLGLASPVAQGFRTVPLAGLDH